MSYPGFARAALPWVEQGYPVFPVSPKDKSPLTTNGFKDATTDKKRVREWGQKHKSANVGIDLEGAGLLVLDVDPRNGGTDSLAKLTKDQLLPLTWVESTVNGGLHYYFRNPDGIRKGKLAGFPGIDIQAAGGYVIAAPSKGYEWEFSPERVELAEPPGWLVDHLGEKASGTVADWEPSGLPPSREVRRYLKEGDWPQGEQREIAVRAARALLDTGMEPPAVAQTIYDCLQESDQDPDNPWTRSEIQRIVKDEQDNPPPPRRDQAEKKANLKSRLSPIDLSETWDETDEAEWVIPGLFLKGKYHEFTGGMGQGKSLSLLGLIVTQAFPAGIRVAYLDEENGPDEIKHRLKALGASPEDVSRYFLYLPDVMPTLGEAQDIVKVIGEFDVQLAVFDSLADFYAAARLDEDSNKDATAWSKAYPERLAREYGIATVGIDHTGHADKDRARGASAKGAKADATWMVEVEREFDVETIGRIKLKRGRKNRQGVLPESHVFQIGGNGKGQIVFEHLADREAEEAKEAEVKKDKELKKAVHEILEEAGIGGLSQNKIFEALKARGLGFNRNKLKPKLDHYVDSPDTRIEVVKSGSRSVYRLRKAGDSDA